MSLWRVGPRKDNSQYIPVAGMALEWIPGNSILTPKLLPLRTQRINLDPGKTYTDCCQPPCLGSVSAKGESGPGDLLPQGSEGNDAKYPTPESGYLRSSKGVSSTRGGYRKEG